MQDPFQNDNTARDLRSRLAVIRHRLHGLTARLTGRNRYIALGATALAVAGLAALGVSAAGSDNPKAASTASSEQQLADRQQDAARADRSTRTAEPSPSASATPSTTTPSTTPNKAATKAPAPAKTPAKPKATTAAPKKTQAPAWVTPMANAPVTSCYGQRWGVLHAGIDYALPAGTPVRSVGAGTVVAAGWAFSGYGISVVVDHGNGYQTHYAHLSDTAVSVGQRVSAATTVGHEGSTGDSTGPHLHFEVHQGMWNQVEPAAWLRARGVNPGGC